MTKQIKLIKFMLILLIFIPIILLCTAIIQTFVLKNKQSELNLANQMLNEQKQELEEKTEILEYKKSDKYKEEFYKHNYPGFGKEGDFDIILN